MLKKDLETRRISRIASLNRFSPPGALAALLFFRVSFAAQRGLFIKQKAAARGNTEQASARFRRSTNGTSLLRNRLWPASGVGNHSRQLHPLPSYSAKAEYPVRRE